MKSNREFNYAHSLSVQNYEGDEYVSLAEIQGFKIGSYSYFTVNGELPTSIKDIRVEAVNSFQRTVPKGAEVSQAFYNGYMTGFCKMYSIVIANKEKGCL